RDTQTQQENGIARAAAVTLTYPELEPTEYAVARSKTSFPYVPGLLSFREVPVVLDALEKLAVLPDVIICDGHGRAHPRRFGLACHLGVYTQIPTVGVAKTRLIGESHPLPSNKGSMVDLWHKQDLIGRLVRTRRNVNPVYVSVGHKVSLSTAADLTLACVTRYRLPETTRLADRIASQRGAGQF
ncbi:MAG: deoxyribonuclease V, partial [Pseudomonadota bacterium]